MFFTVANLKITKTPKNQQTPSRNQTSRDFSHSKHQQKNRCANSPTHNVFFRLPFWLFFHFAVLKSGREEKMKLLVHNFLSSQFLRNVTKGYPLILRATKVEAGFLWMFCEVM
jgi:hypothetical protein